LADEQFGLKLAGDEGTSKKVRDERVGRASVWIDHLHRSDPGLKKNLFAATQKWSALSRLGELAMRKLLPIVESCSPFV